MVDLSNRHRHGLNVPSISDLIQEALDAGRSTRQLATDSGHLVKHQTFQDLSKSAPNNFPKEIKTIRGMSLALNVPESTVVLAYAHSLGVDVSIESGLAARLPKGADSIGIEMQNAVVAVVRAAVKLAVPIDDLQELEAILRRLSGEDLDRAAHLAAELVDQREQAQVDEYLADQRQAQQSPSNVIDPRPKNWDHSPPPPGDEATPAASEGPKGSDDEDQDGGRGADE